MRAASLAALALTLLPGCLIHSCGGSFYEHARFDDPGVFAKLVAGEDGVAFHPADGRGDLGGRLRALDERFGEGNYATTEVRWHWLPEETLRSEGLRLGLHSRVGDDPSTLVYKAEVQLDGETIPDVEARAAAATFAEAITDATPEAAAAWADAFIAAGRALPLAANLTLDDVFGDAAADAGPLRGPWGAGSRSLAAGNWTLEFNLAAKEADLGDDRLERFIAFADDRTEYLVEDGPRNRDAMQERLAGTYKLLGLGEAPQDWASHRSADTC